MLSRLVIAFLPRSKHLLISWLQSPSTVILEPKKIKSIIVSIFSLSICFEVMELDATVFVFWMLSFKSAFSLISSTFTMRSSLPWWWCHLCIWGYWYFSWQSWFQLVLHPALMIYIISNIFYVVMGKMTYWSQNFKIYCLCNTVAENISCTLWYLKNGMSSFSILTGKWFLGTLIYPNG